MDDDTRDLVVRLCTHIGATMEDASVAAITAAGLDIAELRSTVRDLAATIAQLGTIAAAAVALINTGR